MLRLAYCNKNPELYFADVTELTSQLLASYPSLGEKLPYPAEDYARWYLSPNPGPGRHFHGFFNYHGQTCYGVLRLKKIK